MTCPASPAAATRSIATSLQYVDCLSARTSAEAFARLFGPGGGLTGVLTTLLTLYVGLLGYGLLTGRTRLGLAALTPRMTALGLILTFATSWVAYQNVIWSLLTGGPDQIAGLVLGIRGSASQAFAHRLDLVFSAVLDAASEAHAAQGDAKGTTPGDLLSWAALLLLLGTVGVLVTARIALAALLALGPVFIALALFAGTRGLFEGWLRVTVMCALVPLFAVLLGAGALAMIMPVLRDLGDGGADMHQAAAVLVAAVVHCALMLLSLRLVSGLVQAWQVVPAASAHGTGTGPASPVIAAALAARTAVPALARPGPESGEAARDERIRAIVAASASLSAAQRPSLPGATRWSAGSPAPAALAGARAGELARALGPRQPAGGASTGVKGQSA